MSIPVMLWGFTMLAKPELLVRRPSSSLLSAKNLLLGVIMFWFMGIVAIMARGILQTL